jgi:hypothetical protein
MAAEKMALAKDATKVEYVRMADIAILKFSITYCWNEKGELTSAQTTNCEDAADHLDPRIQRRILLHLVEKEDTVSQLPIRANFLLGRRFELNLRCRCVGGGRYGFCLARQAREF